MPQIHVAGPPVHLQLLDILPREAWELYKPVLADLNAHGYPYALGGGLLGSLYGAHARFTKDLDIFVRPEDAEAIAALVKSHGFADLFEKSPYRRDWIYRGIKGETIFDVIFGMANWRAQVDDAWFERGAVIEVDGVSLPLLSREEFIWAKFYVLHRDRSDWPDVLNILCMQGPPLDWAHLLGRIGDDWMFFAGLMCVFRWLCPERVGDVPDWVWDRLKLRGIRDTDPGPGGKPRAELMDTYHDWFGPRAPGEIPQTPGQPRDTHA